MRQHDTPTAVHVQRDKKPHAPVLQKPSKRAEVSQVEGRAREQSHHGLVNPRPFQMPPQRRKAAQCKSYRIANIVIGVITAACVMALIWSYGVAYQVGYEAAEHYFTEVLYA